MLQLPEPLPGTGNWNLSRLPDFMGLGVGNSPKLHTFTQQGCVLLWGIIKKGIALGELKQNVAPLDNEWKDIYSLIGNFFNLLSTVVTNVYVSPPPGRTLNNVSAFCPHCAFVCYIENSQQRALVSLKTINRLGCPQDLL